MIAGGGNFQSQFGGTFIRALLVVATIAVFGSCFGYFTNCNLATEKENFENIFQKNDFLFELANCEQ